MDFIKKALTHFDNGLERYFSKKWHWLITVPATVLTFVLLYLFFCFSGAKYTNTGYRDATAHDVGRVLGSIVIVLSVLYLFFEGYFRRLTGRKTMWAFMVIASALLTLWGFRTAANLSAHHHDSGAMGRGNHWSIIYDIFSTGEIPPVNLYNQYYQPKLYHTVIAYLMRFNMLFINVGDTALSSDYPAYTLSAYHALEFTRVFMICLGVASFYSIYRIFLGLGLSDKKVGVCTAITIMIPEFWYIQFMLNNDGMALSLSLIAFALALEFYKKENIVVLAFAGLSMGLAMMTKINAALLAIPMAVVFLFVFIRTVRNKEFRSKNIGVLLAKFALFAVIVFPIGLYVPISYNIKYGMPFGYVMDLTPTQESKEAYGMYIDPEFYNFFRRCIAFPSEDLFYSPFNYRWRPKIGGVYVNRFGDIDFNCWTAMFKTGFFDEWSDFFNGIGYVGGSLLVAGLYLEVFLVLFAVIAGLWYVVRFFMKKQFKNDPLKQAVLFVLLITYVINYIYFVNRYPVGCSQNSRYVMPIYIALQAVVGSMLCDGHTWLKTRREKSVASPNA